MSQTIEIELSEDVFLAMQKDPKAAGLYLKGNVIEMVQKGIHKNKV